MHAQIINIFFLKKLLGSCVCPKLSEKINCVRPNTESVFGQFRNSDALSVGLGVFVNFVNFGCELSKLPSLTSGGNLSYKR